MFYGGKVAEPEARTAMASAPRLGYRGAAVGRAFGLDGHLGNRSTGEGHRGADRGDRLQHRRPRPGGRPSRRQASERDAFGLELGHGGVRCHDPQPQRRELLQQAGFLHGERVLLL